jgi:hypothetical protein
MEKTNLYTDTVLRRDQAGMLWLMNHQEGGWRSTALPIKSEEAVLAEYNVRLGEWAKDKWSEYCPVTRVPRSEQPTLHDWVEGGLTPEQALGVAMVDALEALYEEGAVEDRCFQPSKVQAGLQQFIDAHPGVRVGMGPGPFLVAIMPDGSAVAVDQDGTVVAEDELGS